MNPVTNLACDEMTFADPYALPGGQASPAVTCLRRRNHEGAHRGRDPRNGRMMDWNRPTSVIHLEEPTVPDPDADTPATEELGPLEAPATAGPWSTVPAAFAAVLLIMLVACAPALVIAVWRLAL